MPSHGASRTRDLILRAARDLVEEIGWESTSSHGVRERAGVSNGSMFHHFPTRRDLHAAVLGAALEEHQALMTRVLGPRRGGRTAVREVVLEHLQWLQDNPRTGLLLVTTPRRALKGALDSSHLMGNADFLTYLDAWLRRRGWGGDPALPVVLNLWLGPANEFARDRLGTPEMEAPHLWQTLADAAWHLVARHLDPAP